ncbi:MAG: serine hydrolase [Burkholderiales bacterium]
MSRCHPIPKLVLANRFIHWLALALLFSLSFLLVPQAEAGSRKKSETKQAASRGIDKKAARAASHERGARRVQATISASRGKNSARAKPVAHSLRPGRQRILVEVERPAPRQSFGEQLGLHSTQDELDLKSSVALVIDQDTHEVLLRKNDQAVLPIASLTKLMTGLILSEARLPLDELITIDQDDVDTEKHSRSRLRVGTTLSRGELLHLALMASENRAAHALGRTFPGGMVRFVATMNARALMLGMKDTRYVEPTGLSSANQSSAIDLAILVSAAHKNALVRQLSTSPGYEVEVGNRLVQFNNTNRLVMNPDWDIGLQKTGYISEAGQCLVMQTKIAGRKLIMVFLDSAGKLSRLGDAERVRRWVEAHPLPFPTLRSSLRGLSGG